MNLIAALPPSQLHDSGMEHIRRLPPSQLHDSGMEHIRRLPPSQLHDSGSYGVAALARMAPPCVGRPFAVRQLFIASRVEMGTETDQQDMLLNAWRTNNRVTVFLVEHLPDELWGATVPGAPRRTVRMIAGHIHNARCMWIKTLGKDHGITVPRAVDRHKVGPKQLIPALDKSSRGIINLLTLGFERGGTIPVSASYTWRNLPLDVGHVLTYFVAHEGHHRGQIVMLARQLGYRLPVEVTGGLWQWSKRSRE